MIGPKLINRSTQIRNFVTSDVLAEQLTARQFSRAVLAGATIPATYSQVKSIYKSLINVFRIKSRAEFDATYKSLNIPHFFGYVPGTTQKTQKVLSGSDSAADQIQTTAASQPLILPHTGTNYVYLPGIDGNGFTTPHSLSNNITQDWEVVIQTNFANSTSNGCLLSKRAFGNSQYQILKLTSGSLYISQTIGGVQFDTICASNIGTSFNGFIKITRNATTGTILIYTSLDGFLYNLQSTNAGPIGTLDTINTPVKIGAQANSLITGYSGDIYRLTISNSIGGNPVVDFNPANYSRATSQTTWTSTTGEVWTLNTPSTNNANKAAIVDFTYLMFNGTSTGMQAAGLNINQTGVSSYTIFRKYVNTAGTQVIAELSSNYIASSGFITYINGASNLESIGIRANVGVYESNYTSTSTSLKLITGIRDITQTNEASPYLVNNVSQSFVSAAVANNTAAMNATDYNLGARNNAASLWANMLFFGDIVTSRANTPTEQTAIYNAIKSALNNGI